MSGFIKESNNQMSPFSFSLIVSIAQANFGQKSTHSMIITR